MSLRGDLRTMALPDVLQWVASGHKTGTLHVERRSVQKRIILREGNIYSSWSNDPRESLGQFLIRMRLVTEEQLFRALLAQEERGRLLGSIMVADGILGEDDLRKALKAKAEETIFDLFLWPSGQFEFREGEFPENIFITYESLVTPVILAVDQVRAEAQATDPVGTIQALLAMAYQRLQEKRYDAAMKAYEDVLALDRLNQNAKKGLIAAMEARQRERQLHAVPRERVPSLAVDLATLTKQNLAPHEGFVLSRVNGQWDVQSILKLCPMTEEEALLIFARLLDRKLIRFS